MTRKEKEQVRQQIAESTRTMRQARWVWGFAVVVLPVALAYLVGVLVFVK